MKNEDEIPERNMYDPNFKHHKTNDIHRTAIIHENVTMGKYNKIGPYTIIGSDGEVRGEGDFEGSVVIGDNNRISELVTIQRPKEKGAKTIIGNDNLIMVHSHISHDVVIGNYCEVCGGSILLGFVTVKDYVKIKVGCYIRNRKTIGKGAIIGMGSVVVKDVPEGTTVVGVPAKKLDKYKNTG